MNPIIKKIAEDTQFNIYNSPIWNGTGERFVEAIIRECANIALREDHDPYECILKYFDIEDIDAQMRKRSTYFGNDV